MGKIAVKNIIPGMVLAGDVKDPQGRLLAPAGQEVSRKLIRVFKIWGIGEVPVRPDAENDPGARKNGPFPRRSVRRPMKLPVTAFSTMISMIRSFTNCSGPATWKKREK